jgi:hypothetical protein
MYQAVLQAQMPPDEFDQALLNAMEQDVDYDFTKVWGLLRQHRKTHLGECRVPLWRWRAGLWRARVRSACSVKGRVSGLLWCARGEGVG